MVRNAKKSTTSSKPKKSAEGGVEKAKKKIKYQRGTIAKRKWKKLVEDSGLFIAKAPIVHLVRQYALEEAEGIRFKATAINDIHSAIEAFADELYGNANTIAESAGKVTVMPKDIKTAYKLMTSA